MPAFINIGGKKYGRLTALKYVDNGKWKCKCDCGNEIITRSAALKNGNTRSCGCLHKESIKKALFDDLTGKRFGSLIVINEVGKRKTKYLWKCQCDCGEFITTLGGCLKNKSITRCKKCSGKHTSKIWLKNMVGKRIGKLTVIRRTKNIDRRGMWLVRCECGTEKVVMGKLLRNGHVVSCGCYKNQLIKERAIESRLNLINQKFGRLLVIEYLGGNSYGRSIFKCKCDCGEEVVITGHNLTTGNNRSCGCLGPDIIRMLNQQPEMIAKHRMGIQIQRMKQNGEIKI